MEGSIERDGKVIATLKPTTELTGSPETKRLWIDFADAGRPAGTLVFENAPGASFFEERKMAAMLEVQGAPGAIPRTVARLRYDSSEQLRSMLRLICDGCAEDVFVTPSTGGGWRDRLADRGRSILARRFDELTTKVFKRDAKTQ